jgi:uncharacterized protein YbjT (DUF2867 family)
MQRWPDRDLLASGWRTSRIAMPSSTEHASPRPTRGRHLVFGASGYVGTNLVARLLAEGLTVRVSARSAAVLHARGWPHVEVVEADALQPDSLAPALADVEVAYYLVHSMAAGKDFGQLDLQAAQHFAAAAAAAGVRRIIYLGGLMPDDASSEHLRSRRGTGDVLRAGAVPVTEIRTGMIVGPGSAAFEVMRDLVYHLPVMVTPRWVHAKSPPIALQNVLEYLVRIAEKREAAGRIFDAGGPESLTYAETMKILAQAAGRREPLIVPVPVLSPRLSSYWLKYVTSVPTNVARALIEGLKHDYVADDTELHRLVPQRLLSFREAVEAVFEAERTSSVQARWTEGAFHARSRRIDYAWYAKRATGTTVTTASAATVWSVLCCIGGENRYFGVDFLWTLRELADWAVGGPGAKRGRRHPTELRVGDMVDSWTVMGIAPERRLTLQLGMKAPGAGILEFELTPEADGRTRLTANAYWHPAGVWGLMYWYALEPGHRVIFSRMTREIARRAEAEEQRSARPIPDDGRGAGQGQANS